jgi:NAD+ kinase
VNAICLTPICPHTLTNRPLLVPSDMGIRVVSRARDEDAYLTVDGQVGSPLEAGDSVECGVADFEILLIRSPERTFFDVLRQKLKWGER